ncbi:Biotin biosynthesis cytochrome P450 (plasmid) [Streptomyces sp. YIM 121038]|uniref:cytochrome P450 n=1 Tax=Streptomyces sp. YIM 121038 TaxID=2136401 RepID=UPI0011105FFF|nr:cytochrome P450 [Streptomyces sp. YIM 121038]QCX82652.1 Biotin biosynthesis cytochrome P450 [Streptomyces sp. YIM 121038]QCX82815.1 Biotin biosynthesis cytochrome P450 [Streptomyces sp. YIM 121038]
MHWTEPVDVLHLMRQHEIRENPYPLYSWLRANHPVYLNPTGNIALISAWRHARIMKDPALRGMSQDRLAGANPRYATSHTLRIMMNSVVNKNRPEHTRLRKVLSPLYAPATVERLRVQVTENLNRRILGIKQRLLDGQTVDLHTELTSPFVADAVGAHVGIPEPDRVPLQHYVHSAFAAFHPAATDAVHCQADQATSHLYAYYADLMDREDPPPGTALDMLGRPDAPARCHITEEERQNLLWVVWMGAHESSIAALDHALITYVAHPQHAPLVSMPDTLTNYIHECLRYEAPLMINASRIAAVKDLDIAGVHVPEGCGVHFLPGAINRDPQQYDNPDTFIPQRTNAETHISFSLGIHRCAGASLATLEMTILLPAFHRHLGALAPALTPDYALGTTQRTLKHLWAQLA